MVVRKSQYKQTIWALQRKQKRWGERERQRGREIERETGREKERATSKGTCPAGDWQVAEGCYTLLPPSLSPLLPSVPSSIFFLLLRSFHPQWRSLRDSGEEANAPYADPPSLTSSLLLFTCFLVRRADNRQAGPATLIGTRAGRRFGAAACVCCMCTVEMGIVYITAAGPCQTWWQTCRLCSSYSFPRLRLLLFLLFHIIFTIKLFTPL